MISGKGRYCGFAGKAVILLAILDLSCLPRRAAPERVCRPAEIREIVVATAAPAPVSPAPGGVALNAESEGEAGVSSKTADVVIRHIRSLIRSGRERRALRVLNGVIKDNPDYGEAYLERAGLYLDRRKYERAAADYRLALANGGDEMKAHYGLGATYEKWAEKLEAGKKSEEASRKYRDAIAEYKEVLWRKPGYAPAYYSLGCIYSRLGRSQEAGYYFKKTIQNGEPGSELPGRAKYNLKLMGVEYKP